MARELGVARTRLEYAVAKAGIREQDRAGILRVFSRDQIPVMEAALAGVRRRRSGITAAPEDQR